MSIQLTIVDDGDGQTHLRTESTGGDPRPAMRRAISAILSEIEGYENCPAHRRLSEPDMADTLNGVLAWMHAKDWGALCLQLAEAIADGTILRAARKSQRLKEPAQ